MNGPARLMARKLCEALENEDYQDVQTLLKGGADPNHLLPEGIAPVHLASGKERESALRCLNLILQHGGDPNARSIEELTPLHVAASWGCSKCLKLLLKNGGDPSLRDQDGNRAIDLAYEQGNRRCAIILQDYGPQSMPNKNCPYTDEHLQLEDNTETISLSELTVSISSDAEHLNSTRISLLCSLPGRAKLNNSLSDTVIASQSQHTSFLSDLEENMCNSTKAIYVGTQRPPLDDLDSNGMADSPELVNSNKSAPNSSTQLLSAQVPFFQANMENISEVLDSLDICGREPALINAEVQHTTFATGNMSDNASLTKKNSSYWNSPKETNVVSGLTVPHCMTTLSTVDGEQDHSLKLSRVCTLNGTSFENLCISACDAISHQKESLSGSNHDFQLNRNKGQDVPFPGEVDKISQAASDACWNLGKTILDPGLPASREEDRDICPDMGGQNISSSRSKYDSCPSEYYISVGSLDGERFEENKDNIPSETHPFCRSCSSSGNTVCTVDVDPREDMDVAALTNQPNAIVGLTVQDLHVSCDTHQPMLKYENESSHSDVGVGKLTSTAFSECTQEERRPILNNEPQTAFENQSHKEGTVSDPNVDQATVPIYDCTSEHCDLAPTYDVLSAQLKGMMQDLPVDAGHTENAILKGRSVALSDQQGHKMVSSKIERDHQQKNEIVNTLPTDHCVVPPSSQSHTSLSLELRRMMIATKSLQSPLPKQIESPCYITARTKSRTTSSPSRNSSSSLFDSTLEMPKRRPRVASPRRRYNSPHAFASPADDSSDSSQEAITLSQSRGLPGHSLLPPENGRQTQSLDDTVILEAKDDCSNAIGSTIGVHRISTARSDNASATVLISQANDDRKSSESDQNSSMMLPGSQDTGKTGSGEPDDSIPTMLIKHPATGNFSDFFTDDKSSSFTDERKPIPIKVTNFSNQPLILDTENSLSDNTWMTENGEQSDHTGSVVQPSVTGVTRHEAGLYPFGLSGPPKPRNHTSKSRTMFHSTLLATRPSVTDEGSPLRPRYSFSRLSSGLMPTVSTSSDTFYPIQDMPSFDITLSPGGRPMNESINEPVEYLYMDPEKGHALIERHYPGTDDSTQDSTSSSDTIIYDWTTYKSEQASPIVKGNQSLKINGKKILPELYRLSNDDIMAKLRELGENPGPITSLTRRVYLSQLDKLMKDPQKKGAQTSGYSTELTMALQTFQIPDCTEDEIIISKQFDQPDKNVKWREGVLKSSFNYLLLDPRVTRNLPCRCLNLSQAESFRTFISAIFYVGKGKRSRPYSHLYEALTHYRTKKKQACQKVQHILEIWQAGLGVVSLHCFQNAIPVEAFTREACMVDAIGLKMLTNQVKGNYYGYSQDWPMKRRRRLGVHMLHRAMQIFLAEGERQLRPADIRIGQ